ncbi:hypothetical protein B0H19DRAFT_1241827 [Mycena capillaripes]|nr:hypothetical protein B0H19DRAFT_1241827 [Mycena capillaripes]
MPLLLPQELIDSIVDEVHDIPTLKSCALAGSPCLRSSQRILLASLTLSPGSDGTRIPANYSAAQMHLTESPHVASYVTQLTIQVSWHTSSAEVEDLLQVLNLLTRVRLCILDGRKTLLHWGRELDCRLADAIPSFLLRQPLHELIVDSVMQLPLSTLARFLRTAAAVSFLCVYLDQDDPAELSGVRFSQASPLKRLSFSHGCDTVCKVLALPQFTCHLSGLRDLEIPIPYIHPDDVPGQRLISYSAHTLERIGVRVGGNSPRPMRPLPHLPALLRLEFILPLPTFDVPWLVDTSLTFIHSSPTLSELLITFDPLPTPMPSGAVALGRRGDLLADLDCALVEHPAGPSVTWRLELSADDETTLNKVVAVVLHAMPRMHDAGRLFFTRESINRVQWGI